MTTREGGTVVLKAESFWFFSRMSHEVVTLGEGIYMCPNSPGSIISSSSSTSTISSSRDKHQ